MLNSWLNKTAEDVINGTPLTRNDALKLLQTTDDDVLEIVAAGAKIRRHFFANCVDLSFLISMKSGACPEDCSYCSQRQESESKILKYSWINAEETADYANLAAQQGAKRVCLVAAGRGPTTRDLSRVQEAIEAIKKHQPELEICACLGLLKEDQAQNLEAAGLSIYSHNLNASENLYSKICTTHSYTDRAETLNTVKNTNLGLCSGAIFGMGESDDDIVDLAFSLRDLAPNTVPINFLIPFEGTPFSNKWELTPQRCLRILTLFRFVLPDTELRLAAGREIHLRTLQPLALHLANSILLGDYLTSEGQDASADIEMITDSGFVIKGINHKQHPSSKAQPDPIALRQRGPGTDTHANI